MIRPRVHIPADGIGTVFAEALPEEKAERIKELRRQGKRVAMVGMA